MHNGLLALLVLFGVFITIYLGKGGGSTQTHHNNHIIKVINSETYRILSYTMSYFTHALAHSTLSTASKWSICKLSERKTETK